MNNKAAVSALDEYQSAIREAESHIANAKRWLREARKGNLDQDFHIDEALAEASTILSAAIPEA